MLIAAMLAMVLAAAAPAIAQTAVGGDVAVLQYSCDQIQAAVNTQYQAGEGTGAVAGAAQSLGIDQQQVLACFGTAAAAQDTTIVVGNTASATASAGGGGGGGWLAAEHGWRLSDRPWRRSVACGRWSSGPQDRSVSN